VVVLQDLLDLAHWLTRLKVVPESAVGAAELERTRGVDMAKRLAMAQLTRTWQMLLKGLEETQKAPSPIRAAEMVAIRLCYAANLPAPADALRMLEEANGGTAAAGNGGASRAALPSGAGSMSGGASPVTVQAPARPAGTSGPSVARLATSGAATAAAPAAGVAAEAPASRPSPVTFAEVVALFEQCREPVLAHHLSRDIHPVRCEPGRLEFRPAPAAPRDLAPRIAELLSQWTGRRWMVSVSGDAGEPTLAQQRAVAEDARRARAMGHPLVQAALAAFPDATLEAVRTKEETALVPPSAPADSGLDGEELPEAEDYPVDAFDEFPERD
jgi:DNA polymerase-3 subunit gamma/tau